MITLWKSAMLACSVGCAHGTKWPEKKVDVTRVLLDDMKSKTILHGHTLRTRRNFCMDSRHYVWDRPRDHRAQSQCRPTNELKKSNQDGHSASKDTWQSATKQIVTHFVNEAKFSEFVANMVIVQKANPKWRIFIIQNNPNNSNAFRFGQTLESLPLFDPSSQHDVARKLGVVERLGSPTLQARVHRLKSYEKVNDEHRLVRRVFHRRHHQRSTLVWV